MIIPWLRGFLSRELAPLTWTLLILNCYVFVMTYDSKNNHHQEFFADNKKFELTARLYFQYKGNSGLPHSDQVFSYAMQGLRDYQFISQADQLTFQGDQIQIHEWQQDLVQFRENINQRPMQIFGLSWNKKDPLTWITYQFMHAGIGHLLGNMLLLFIFAGALESLIGGFGLVAIYILSGIAGAIGFLTLGESTLAPMVGASGSLSGIMAFYAVYENKQRIPFFYFLSPLRGFYGKIWLSKWMIFPLFFVADIAAYLSTTKEVGSGVAYTAHIGGMVFGVLSGLAVKKWKIHHSDTESKVMT